MDARTKQQIYSISDQLVVSGSNFTVQFLIARQLGPGEFGQFSLVFLAAMFLSNLHRAYFTQPYNILAVDLSGQAVDRYRGGLAVLQLPWVVLGAAVVASVGLLLAIPVATVGAAIAYFAVFQLHELARRTALTSESLRDVLRNDLVTYGSQAALVLTIPKLTSVSASGYFLLMASAFSVSIVMWLLSGFNLSKPRYLDLSNRVVEHWKFSTWLVLAVFVTWGASQLYPFMLGPWGVATVGAFVAARNLVNITNVPIQAINGFIPSVMARHISRGEVAALTNLMRRLALLLGFTAISLVAVMFSFSTEIVHLVYGDKYAQAAPVLQMLIIGGAVSVLTVRQSSLLIALGKTQAIFRGNLAATLFSMTAGLLLVYYKGALGAAIAASVALGINYVLQYRSARLALRGFVIASRDVKTNA